MAQPRTYNHNSFAIASIKNEIFPLILNLRIRNNKMERSPLPNHDHFTDLSEGDRCAGDTPQSDNESVNLAAGIKKIMEKERELTRKTEILEQMVQNQSNLFNRAVLGGISTERLAGHISTRNFELPLYTTPDRNNSFFAQPSGPLGAYKILCLRCSRAYSIIQT